MPELTPVRGIVTAPQTEPLSGIKTSYDVTVGTTGATERWAYAPTTNSPNGGIYDVTTAGVWTRAPDLNDPAEFNNMPWFQVEEGNSRIGGSVWWYSGIKNPVINTTNIPFTLRSYGSEWEVGGGLTADGNTVKLIERPDVAGTWPLPELTLNNFGVSTAASSMAAFSTFIEGLLIRTELDVSTFWIDTGAAYVPDLGHVVDFTADQLITLLSSNAPANSWLYFYLTEVNKQGYILWETTAPNPPYRGTARDHPTKLARLIAVMRTTATAGNIRRVAYHPFGYSSIFARYLEATGVAPFAVLSGGTATTRTTISCNQVVPPISQKAWVWINNTGTATVDFSMPGVTPNNILTVKASGDAYVWLDLDSLQ